MLVDRLHCRSVVSPGAELNVDELYLKVFQAAFRQIRLYEPDDFGEHLVGMTCVGGDTGDADFGTLPRVLLANFRGSYMELVHDARQQ